MKNNELLSTLVELNEAIEAYDYLTMTDEVLTESLVLHIQKVDMGKLLQTPIGKLFATLNNADLFPLMKEFNKKLSDYKITGKDSSLTINKMKIYVYINGTNDEKELMKDKIESISSRIQKASSKADDVFEVPYGSIRAIYSLYKRVEKRVSQK